MSFGDVNMCRFVIAVIFISLVSCVLSETPKNLTNETLCANFPVVKDSRNKLKRCFTELVERHLHTNNRPGECKNINDFRQRILTRHSILNETCKINLKMDTVDLTMNFINFSLSNEAFKELYKDIICLKNMERNISQCVKTHVGFFNVTKDHGGWYRRLNLQYDENTCKKSTETKNCTEVVLNNCRPTTRQYVASLFEFSSKNCGNYTTPAPPSGTITTKSAPWMILITIIVKFI